MSKQQKNSSNKGKYNNKGGKRADTSIHRGKMFNDVSWYTKNPGITKAFANLPFNFIKGSVLPIPSAGVKGVVLDAVASFGVDWLPAFKNSNKVDGRITDSHSVLDQVATIIYTQMRRSNSGATNDIEFVDPIISNLIASIDIMVNSVSMRRVFKLVNSFSWKDRTLPRNIFRDHLGLDYDDFVANQALYRGKFNTLVAYARTIKTLSGYPFINAICAEFENVFKDSDTETGRESLIIPVKYFHHIYDPVGTTTNPGGSVRIMTWKDLIPGVSTPNKAVVTAPTTTPRKFSVDLALLEKQITTLINDGDFNLIQADLEKAFGEQSSYMVIDSVPDSEEPMKPIYSGEFMTMFHNGAFIPMPALSVSTTLPGFEGTGYTTHDYAYVNTVGQWHADDGGEIKMLNIARVAYYGNSARGAEITSMIDFPLDSEADVPTDSDIIMMTRYRGNWVKGDIVDVDPAYELSAPTSGRSWNSYVPSGASNFICFGGNVTVYRYMKTGLVVAKTSVWSNTSLGDPGLESGLWQIKHRPIFRNITLDSSLIEPIYCYVTDLNNIRFLYDTELLAIQQSCFLSLWDLPSKTNI